MGDNDMSGTSPAVLDTMPVIDTDSHITEPADLWTSRVSKKWLDGAPKVAINPATGIETWLVNDYFLRPPTQLSHAGWKEFHPGYPRNFEEAHAGAWDPKIRLDYMDEMGVYAAVLYPNILGFSAFAFLDFENEQRNHYVRVFNDYVTEFTAVDPHRFIPVMFLPFWDLEESVRELDRCVELGFKGINFGLEVHKMGFEPLSSPAWEPVLSRAQEYGLSINFHTGFSTGSKAGADARQKLIPIVEDGLVKSFADEFKFVASTALFFLSNASGIAEITMSSNLCQDYPELNFVSVESGYGYVPYLLDALDWHFKGSDLGTLFPDRLLPSEYFRRQVYATFWFEKNIAAQIDQYPDNVMFETDYPHFTCLAPGPGTIAKSPAETIRENLTELDEATARKVLYETASKVYHLPVPADRDQRFS